MGFPCGSAGKESACNVGDLGLIPGLGRSLGEGKGYPVQYSGLENSMDCIVHGVAESDTTKHLSFHFVIKYRRVLKLVVSKLVFINTKRHLYLIHKRFTLKRTQNIFLKIGTSWWPSGEAATCQGRGHKFNP